MTSLLKIFIHILDHGILNRRAPMNSLSSHIHFDDQLVCLDHSSIELKFHSFYFLSRTYYQDTAMA